MIGDKGISVQVMKCFRSVNQRSLTVHTKLEYDRNLTMLLQCMLCPIEDWAGLLKELYFLVRQWGDTPNILMIPLLSELNLPTGCCCRWRTVEHYARRCRATLQLLEQLDLIGQTSELARLFGILFYSVLSRGSQVSWPCYYTYQDHVSYGVVFCSTELSLWCFV